MMTEGEERARRLFGLLGVQDKSFMEFWATSSSEALKPFWVVNTTGHKKIFLSETAELALYLAVHEGHLRKRENGNSSPVSESYLNKYAAIKRAVVKGIADEQPRSVTRFGEPCDEQRSDFPPLRLVK